MDDYSRGAEPLRGRYSDDPDMGSLLDQFASELPDRVRRLEECITDGRLHELRQLAHQLRGASGGFGFTALGEAAARVEESVRAAADLERLREEVDELVGVCRRIGA